MFLQKNLKGYIKFVIVTGDFDTFEVMDFIERYTKNIKRCEEKPKVIKPKEKESVEAEYEELCLDVNEPKIIVGYKIKIPKGVDIIKYKIMLGMGISNEFGSTGDAFEELNNLGIKRTNYGMEVVDDYMFVYFKASTDKCDDFLKVIEKYLKKLKMDEESLERKKRGKLSNLILSFEDIMQVEDIVATEIFTYNKLINNRDDIIKSITLNEINDALKSIDLNNKSILKIVSK